MPYTFGAGTGDDINYASFSTMGASATAWMVAGWWLPTTLTATRGLWSAGDTVGAEVDSTTDEIRLRTDNTTDGQWTTTGVDMATGTWRFIAMMGTALVTGTAAAWRVWAGGIDSQPVECTVTNAVSPSGSFTGNSTFYIGNKGTATQAWQGDIAHVTQLRSSNTAPLNSLFNLAAYGAITQAEADLALANLVMPLWQGDIGRVFRTARNDDGDCGRWHVPLTDGALAYGNNSSVVADPLFTPTAINGATLSANGPPRPNHVFPPTWAGRRR